MAETDPFKILVNDMTKSIGESIDSMSNYSVKYMRNYGTELGKWLDTPKIKRLLEKEAFTMAIPEIKDKIHNELVKKFPGYSMGKVPILCVDNKIRNYDPDSLSELIARTRTRDLREIGFHQNMVQAGLDLVVVSIGGSGDACRTWEGKVLSITGETAGYPTVEEVRATREIWHPRCVHSTSPFMLYTEEETGEIGVLGRDMGSWADIDKNFGMQLKRLQSKFTKSVSKIAKDMFAAVDEKAFPHQKYWSKDFEKKLDDILKYNGEPTTLETFELQLKRLLDDPDIIKALEGPFGVLGEGGRVAQFKTDILRFYKEFLDAPTVIRVNTDVFPGLLKTGRTKNLFETGYSSGTSSVWNRTRWERRMTGDMRGVGLEAKPNLRVTSGKVLTDTERPTYGLSGLPDHLKSNMGKNYGDHYIVLKDNVKARSTFSYGDSDSVFDMGSFTKNNILTPFRRDADHAVDALRAVVKGNDYLETQIWGGVNLSTDVEKILIGKRLAGNQLNSIIEIAKKYNLKIGYADVMKVDDLRIMKESVRKVVGIKDYKYFDNLLVTKGRAVFNTELMKTRQLVQQFGLTWVDEKKVSALLKQTVSKGKTAAIGGLKGEKIDWVVKNCVNKGMTKEAAIEFTGMTFEMKKGPYLHSVVKEAYKKAPAKVKPTKITSSKYMMPDDFDHKVPKTATNLEALEWADENLPASIFQYGRLDGEFAYIVNREVYTQYESWGKLRPKKLKSIGGTSGAVMKKNWGVNAWVTTKNGIPTELKFINTYDMKSAAKSMRGVLDSLKNRGMHWSASTRMKNITPQFSAEFLVDHELGHILDSTLFRVVPFKKYRYEWDALWKANEGAMSKLVSVYAQRTPTEGFAEAYAWYVNQHKIVDKIPKFIEDYFDNLFKMLQS